ncbi:unnamed protein product [Amoebophrya sp. A25]|nr:unnamed protein product [Amoebophrya sp. A25]|eukprot:GSA25T00019358001.1
MNTCLSSTAGSRQPASASELVTRFKRKDFEVTDFVTEAVSESQGSDYVASLANVLDEALVGIQNSLHAEVVLCHDKLLDNTFSLELLDRELSQVRENVTLVKRSMSEVKAQCLSPFRTLKRKVMLLGRAQEVNVLIRRLTRFDFDLKKLKAHVDPVSGGVGKEYGKAAHTVFELESALTENGLDRVASVKREVNFIRSVGESVRRRAREDLYKGLREYNPQLLEDATQAFFNMGRLEEELHTLATDLVTRLDELLVAIDRPPPQVPAGAPAGSALSSVIDPFLTSASTVVKQAEFLDPILQTKADPLTHEKFKPEKSFLQLVWEKLFVDCLSERVKAAVAKTKPSSVLADEFPLFSRKLQTHLLDVLDRESFLLRKQLFGAVDELHASFVHASLTRLTEPVELMLPEKVVESAATVGGDAQLPTLADLRRYVQIINGEQKHGETGLNFVQVSVMKNIRTSVLLFVTRLELLTDAGGLIVSPNYNIASANGGAPEQQPQPFVFTTGHQRNSRLFAMLALFHALMQEKMPKTLPPQLWSHIETLEQSFLDPFFQTISIKFKQEVFPQWRRELLQRASGATPSTTAASPALATFLNTFVGGVANVYLSQYGQPQHVEPHALRYAKELERAAVVRLCLGPANADAESSDAHPGIDAEVQRSVLSGQVGRQAFIADMQILRESLNSFCGGAENATPVLQKLEETVRTGAGGISADACGSETRLANVLVAFLKVEP